MAHGARTDPPELPDFSLLKRLARDHLIFQLEKVEIPPFFFFFLVSFIVWTAGNVCRNVE